MNQVTGKNKGKQLEGCGHKFHKACIHQYYKNGGRTCPNCRHAAKNIAPTTPVSNAEQARLQAQLEAQRIARDAELLEDQESRRRQELIEVLDRSFARIRRDHPLW